ncbi:MAG: DUF86 domain-containing protein [Chloroflexi bacterium]|nr:DUF86 domain-containing protein [Chloroflexota bacterium]
MSLSAHEYLQHILDETTFIQRRSRKLTRAKFMRDETLRRAFVRSIEVIGEATKQIPDEFRQQYPQIDWRAMAGMRDHLIHGYFGIDYDIVWDVVKNKLPSLKTQIDNILTGEID